ncbi:MAG: AAA domain-containing protein, partial [Chitinophagales bacterium]
QSERFLQKQHLFSDYYRYKQFILRQDISTQNMIEAIAATGDNDWESIFTTYYLNQFILQTAAANGIKDDTQLHFNELQQKDIFLKQVLEDKIHHHWQENIHQLLENADISELKYLYNQRKNKQFASKNSLRKIIHHDIDFFTTLFPVLMVNPSVCTSILPLQKDLFDFIILDEASQLRLEDTFTSLLRGKIKIISGDKHQMPPSNFFGSETIFWEEDETENETENFLAESKSLLEYADDANYKNAYLDFHYRSLHPDLIQFSNHAFYQSRLIPMPEKEHYPALFYKQTDGLYTQGTNKKEAAEIVAYVYQLQKINGAYPSIGIATFNIFQRDLILDELYHQAYADNEKNELLQELLKKGLFVKNLENIQGDERDIMLLSTTFGKDENGKFRQLFGPISQEKGYQLLNVIVTRAKHSLHVFTSIPETVFMNFESELKQKGNRGKGIFYAYLAFVKSKYEHNESMSDFILNVLDQNAVSATTQKRNQPSITFKDLIFSELKKHFGTDIRQDFPFGGFILDIVLFKNNHPFLHIDLEKADNYHSGVAYRSKLHRQKVLADYGILTYHLWSYHWWKDADSELKNISKILQ